MVDLDRKIRISFPVFIGILAVAVFGGIYLSSGDFGLFGSGNEIERIKTTASIEQQSVLYRELLERLGPEKGQEELFRSGLPFTGQTHLLNHTAGDYIYEEYGTRGLPKCKEYFLGSCFHGFILRAIASGGMNELGQVLDECRKSGPATLSQCSHAIGHGSLAYVGYENLTDALKMCDKAVESEADLSGFSCYDGVFMENIWGVHDGEPSPDRWIREADPFYPCNDKRIDAKYHLGCWSNQPALMYQLTRGNIEKVGQMCEQVVNSDNKNMCFNGLSRQIHPITAGSVDAVFNKCGLLPTKWTDYCVVTNALAYFGVGDRELPFKICSRIDNGESKDQCYGSVFSSMRSYGETDKKLCNKIEDAVWRDSCVKLLNQNN